MLFHSIWTAPSEFWLDFLLVFIYQHVNVCVIRCIFFFHHRISICEAFHCTMRLLSSYYVLSRSTERVNWWLVLHVSVTFFIPEFFFFIAVHRNVSKISRISRISTEELIGFFIRLRSNSAEICSYQNPKNTQAIHNYIWTRMNDDYLIFCSEKIRHRERNEHSVVLCFCSLFIACSHRPHNQRVYMQLSNWTYGLFMYDLPFTELRLYVSDVWWEWYENPLILFLCFWTCVCLQLLLLSHSSQITIFYYTNGI